ncbi:DET1 homolog [Anastrepha obliqua]|uniref:DET1 homolog n=1 Tax=Anastrepha obliqua TaxID=95512 RepID=UPI002409EBAC|nr:DET1 homolog [Anastrepha obliqua]
MDKLLEAIEILEQSSIAKKRSSWFTERVFTQNIQHHIWDRESGLNRYNRRGRIPELTHTLEFYKSITPRLSILGVGSSLGFICRFSPDGNLLVCISCDFNSVWVHKYKGVHAVLESVHGVKDEGVKASADTGRLLNEKLFHLLWNIPLFAANNTHWVVIRDFCLFVENGRYVLMAAKACSHGRHFTREDYLNYPDLFDDVEMFDFTLFVIDLVKGRISDVYQFRDYVFVTTHYGISIMGNKVAILSFCRQIIEVFELQDGKLVSQFVVNREQETLRRETLISALHTNGVPEPMIKGLLSQIKQKCFASMYREIIECHEGRERQKRLRQFYNEFNVYDHMKMAKSQFINEDTLFIRFEATKMRRYVLINSGQVSVEELPNFKLYVFYSLSEDKVLKCYHNDSVELFNIRKNFYDSFRTDRSLQTGRPASTLSNNIYFRSGYDIYFKELGDEKLAAERLNPSLPVNCQTTICSPYFDGNMFKFDDRYISPAMQPKKISPKPIRFRDRYTSVMKFRLHMNISRINKTRCPQYCSFIFHPYEPFIISIQRIDRNYVVNFHLYCESTVVPPGKRIYSEHFFVDDEDKVNKVKTL